MLYVREKTKHCLRHKVLWMKKIKSDWFLELLVVLLPSVHR